MLKNKLIEQINEQVSSLIKNTPVTDIEKNLKSILATVLSKLDLVTREEFDTQQKVLLTTRQKLEELEEQIKKIIK